MIDKILNKLRIDFYKVLPEQKQKYLKLLRNLPEKDIYNVISKWEDPDITYDNLLELFVELSIPYVTDNSYRVIY